MKIQITLNDGSTRMYEDALSLFDIARDISKTLSEKSIVAEVNGKLTDMNEIVTSDCNVNFIVANKTSPEAIEVIRHSAAHLLAQATKELYPTAQIGIGPTIENGFYYDFLTEKPFSSDDLKKIEKRMHEIASRAYKIEKKILSREDVKILAKKKGEELKLKIVDKIPEGEKISVYTQGDFDDICRGPHVPNTKFIKHFALTKVSGSYWEGNSKNTPLQRIYGTAWTSKEELESYLKRVEEAEKRDHRKIGKNLDLFHQQPEAPGDIFWHPNGYFIFLKLQEYMRKKLRKDYEEIKTPQLMQRKIWEDSGHWSKFDEHIFTINADDHDYAIKPMNCPGHIQVFKNAIRSYKDLPLRFSEFGCCHRWEPSGSMHGIMRVRAFTQDDAHIFCTFEQIEEEVARFIDMLEEVYKDLGFDDISIKLSTRPEKRSGSEEAWDTSEKALEDVMKKSGKSFEIQEGEGAFYGPKLEFVLRDCIGREWQCGTIQVDLILPVNLNAQYVDVDNTKKHPVMIHRALLGSFERFIGILIEHYAGKFPFWLAPTQVMVCGITNKQDEAVKGFYQKLYNANIRAKYDIRPEKIGYKIKENVNHKIPYMAIIGQSEVENGTVSVRDIYTNKEIKMGEDEFIEFLCSLPDPLK
ncbi:threonine--tRNA ligase [Rickettsiales bacterium]|nr:threonine--tRNA ligase [Rickettsiales bacterium]